VGGSARPVAPGWGAWQCLAWWLVLQRLGLCLQQLSVGLGAPVCGVHLGIRAVTRSRARAVVVKKQLLLRRIRSCALPLSLRGRGLWLLAGTLLGWSCIAGSGRGRGEGRRAAGCAWRRAGVGNLPRCVVRQELAGHRALPGSRWCRVWLACRAAAADRAGHGGEAVGAG